MIKKLIALGLIAALPLTAPIAPLSAQRSDPTTAEAIDATKRMYGPAPPTTNCAKPTKDQTESEITVCAAKPDDKEFRVQSSSQLDPDSKEATNDGRPHAPDFAESCKKNPKGTCIKFGNTPVPAYILDFELLPDTPQGSDADKIAKGEMKAD